MSVGKHEDDTDHLKLREVAVFVRRGLSQEDAERIVGTKGIATNKRGHRMGWLPTPDEIAERAAEIRGQWLRGERELRTCKPIARK